jgi:hypothetical protein
LLSRRSVGAANGDERANEAIRGALQAVLIRRGFAVSAARKHWMKFRTTMIGE